MLGTENSSPENPDFIIDKVMYDSLPVYSQKQPS